MKELRGLFWTVWGLPCLVLLLCTGGLACACWLYLELAREFMTEALHEEGGALVQPLSDAFFEHLERHHLEEGMNAEAVIAAAKQLDGEQQGLIAVDYEGRNLLGTGADQDLMKLVGNAAFIAAMQRFRRDGVKEFLLDNYEAVASGTAEYGARAQFRVYDGAKVVLGYGRVQTGARARMRTYAAQVRHAVTVYGGAGLAVLLAGVGLSGWAAHWLLQRRIGRPLRQLHGLLRENGDARQAGGLAGARVLMESWRAEREKQRREALSERAARMQAEEERDALADSQRRVLRDAAAAAEARARESLIAWERDLLRRVAAAVRERVGPLLRDSRQLTAAMGAVEREAGMALAEISGECSGLRPELEEIEVETWLPGVVAVAGGAAVIRCEAGLRISADGPMLGRALAGLAARAGRGESESGQVRVEVAQGDGTVEFRVVNQGKGMSGRVRALAEEALFTEEATGLGGEIRFARCVAEAHGGTLQVHSEAGRGTAVVLSLPSLN